MWQWPVGSGRLVGGRWAQVQRAVCKRGRLSVCAPLQSAYGARGGGHDAAATDKPPRQRAATCFEFLNNHNVLRAPPGPPAPQRAQEAPEHPKWGPRRTRKGVPWRPMCARRRNTSSGPPNWTREHLLAPILRQPRHSASSQRRPPSANHLIAFADYHFPAN